MRIECLGSRIRCVVDRAWGWSERARGRGKDIAVAGEF
jgi:hypothetical protein